MSAPEPYFTDGQVTLHLGKCEAVLPGLPPDSVDAIVTDPPAAVSFMGREWDSDRGGRDQWVAWLAGCMTEVLRVLKPGGHALVWALPRTSGWTQWALEDAGFEIRDCVTHIYGSGFPKSHSVPKATLIAVESRYGSARCDCLDAADGRPDRDGSRRKGGPQARLAGGSGEVQASRSESADLSVVQGSDLGALRELRTDDTSQAARSEPLAQTVLLAGVRGCGTEAARFGDAAVRPWLEESPRRGQTPGSGVPVMRENAGAKRAGTSCASPGALPVRGDEPAGELGSAVRFVPSHDRGGDGSSAGIDPGHSESRGTVLDGNGGRCAAVARVCSWCGLPDPDWLRSLESLGTALKPGQEMWWLARKPLGKGTVAANVLEHGTGALNVAACRVGNGGQLQWAKPRDMGYQGGTDSGQVAALENAEGRWPTNIVLTHSASCEVIGTRQIKGDSRSGQEPGRRPGGFGDTGADVGAGGPNGTLRGDEVADVWRCAPDCPVGELDRQSGSVASSGTYAKGSRNVGLKAGAASIPLDGLTAPQYSDTGGASRFYPTFRYQAKAPASERPRLADGTAHSTVKSLGLMRWLARLITPPGGTVLDLFAGTGTTAEACIVEGFRSVLIEQDPKSAELIRTRLRKDIQPDMFGGAA